MKRWIARIAIGIVSLIVLLVGAVLVKFYVLAPESRPAPNMTAPTTPEAIARGRYLATNVMSCVNCHSKSEATQPGDPVVEDSIGGGREYYHAPGDEFELSSSNITPDKTVGIGNASDGQIVRAIREGIGQDGRPLFPMMPYSDYGAALNDDDALAIVAYLRTLKPLPNKPRPLKVPFPVSMFVRGAPKPVTKPAGPVPSEPLARGNWLMTVAACGDCHEATDDHMEPIPGKHLAGGRSFHLQNGVVYASNITQDQATGLGAYTDEDLLRVFNEGKTKAGKPIYQMPWTAYRGMTDEDKKALITALRAVPPVNNPVPPSTVKPEPPK